MSAANRGADRHPFDFYQTPDYSIKSLLSVLDFNKVNSFIEPCRGVGNIYNQIPVENKYYAEILEGKDYLNTKFKKVDLIVTNPPFSLAQEFIEKSLGEARSVWYLLRINFLASKIRSEWWNGKEPTHLLTLSARPSFRADGKTDATEYAWFGWDELEVCKLSKGIHVLPYNKPRKNE